MDKSTPNTSNDEIPENFDSNRKIYDFHKSTHEIFRSEFKKKTFSETNTNKEFGKKKSSDNESKYFNPKKKYRIKESKEDNKDMITNIKERNTNFRPSVNAEEFKPNFISSFSSDFIPETFLADFQVSSPLFKGNALDFQPFNSIKMKIEAPKYDSNFSQPTHTDFSPSTYKSKYTSKKAHTFNYSEVSKSKAARFSADAPEFTFKSKLNPQVSEFKLSPFAVMPQLIESRPVNLTSVAPDFIIDVPTPQINSTPGEYIFYTEPPQVIPDTQHPKQSEIILNSFAPLFKVNADLFEMNNLKISSSLDYQAAEFNPSEEVASFFNYAHSTSEKYLRTDMVSYIQNFNPLASEFQLE